MLLHLKNVLTRDQDVKFKDGKASAGMAAARVKNNLEADRSVAAIAKIDSLVMGALVRHADYRAGALPLKVAAPFYARYVPDMRYGDHVDDPIMGGEDGLYRTDVAITVFLNEPAEYDGGELTVNTAYVNLFRMWSEL